MKYFICLLVLSTWTTSTLALEYMKPDKQIVQLVESGEGKGFSLNGTRTYGIEYSTTSTPDIDYLSRPKLGLAGLEFFPSNSAPVDSSYITALSGAPIRDMKVVGKMTLLAKGRLSFPHFSPDETRFAFANIKEKCVELFVGDIHSQKVKSIPDLCLNTLMGQGIMWIDNENLLVRQRVSPKHDVDLDLPLGPIVTETSDNKATNRTYQNLLKGPRDELLFENYARAQLTLININSGEIKQMGDTAIYASYALSPDHQYLLVKRINPPYSNIVPVDYFAMKVEVWNIKGKVLKEIASRPVLDHLPIGGVAQGKRLISWIPSSPSSLFYVEALDKGDWKVKVKHRDQVGFYEVRNDQILPLQNKFLLVNRFDGIDSFEDGRRFVLWDYERDSKRLKGKLVDLFTGKEISTLFDFGVNDSYNNPGNIRLIRNQYGEYSIRPLMRDDREWILLSGNGATPQGDLPFLRMMDLQSKEIKELFRSQKGELERVGGFYDQEYQYYFTELQSRTLSPRIILRSLNDPAFKKEFWHTDDKMDVFTKVKSEIVTYKRKDGILLSGILYYPTNFKKGKKYPLVISAYPRQFSSSDEAGQVRGSSSKYLRPFRASVLYFTLKGYLVLDKAQMPIVGHPDHMNDSFLEQIEMNARAAIDAVKKKGIVDGDRVAITGHSYGAFMVANLLTHTDLFKTGIARSGAYNRTLTPYGFQNERRTFWEAPDTYLKISPFMTAPKNHRPILLIHGEDDDNPGTFPMQSERYFSALQGNGGHARLVVFPKEGHSYAAKESVMHLIWEQLRWLELYL